MKGGTFSVKNGIQKGKGLDLGGGGGGGLPVKNVFGEPPLPPHQEFYRQELSRTNR